MAARWTKGTCGPFSPQTAVLVEPPLGPPPGASHHTLPSSGDFGSLQSVWPSLASKVNEYIKEMPLGSTSQSFPPILTRKPMSDKAIFPAPSQDVLFRNGTAAQVPTAGHTMALCPHPALLCLTLGWTGASQGAESGEGQWTTWDPCGST